MTSARSVLVLSLALVTVAGCSHKPRALSDSIFSKSANYYYHSVSHQDPIAEPLTLYEAMARALKYNWDYRVQAQEAAFRKSELVVSSYSMLPEVAANAGYSGRDNILASDSLDLLTRERSGDSSSSQDKEVGTTDISFGWNILDFGLSYIRAKQLGDRYWISQESRRKAMQKLLEDVRTSFWRAQAYEHLYGQLKALHRRVEKNQYNNRLISQSGKTPRLQALIAERELVEIKRALNGLQEEIRNSKTKLAALINIRPGTDFKLVAPKHEKMPVALPLGPDELTMIALRDRSEIHEKLYQQRINQQEAQAAVLQLVPSLKLYTGQNSSSNSFLVNANWVDWGAAASWNLLQVFQYPAQRRSLKAQDKLLDMQTKALSMSILSQVHISQIQYQQARQSYKIASEYLNVQRRLLRQIRLEFKANRVGEQKLLHEELNSLIAETKYDLAYADLQSAYAQIFRSIGWDPCHPDDSRKSVEELSAQLERAWTTSQLDMKAKKPQQVSSEPRKKAR
ncbi:TolC family protein [uncultured Cohaesibacter sp.]|uniref:TolC family protein n=1 Tax=uncultured Cohaesibacter sp. TaxID=1002546 RepID=UPI00292FDDC6|nr:TolC family protein [uncultured Cohaesibacter sp.]